jgi:hypothetical protein
MAFKIKILLPPSQKSLDGFVSIEYQISSFPCDSGINPGILVSENLVVFDKARKLKRIF